MAEEIEFPEPGTYPAGNADPIALERLAGTAARLRNIAAMAWRESGLATLGYLHEMTVSEEKRVKPIQHYRSEVFEPECPLNPPEGQLSLIPARDD
jgi:hypothetical protein